MDPWALNGTQTFPDPRPEVAFVPKGQGSSLAKAVLKTYVHFWTYLAKYSLERKNFKAKTVKKVKYTFYVQYIFSITHSFQ
jgi:hypothetical protein